MSRKRNQGRARKAKANADGRGDDVDVRVDPWIDDPSDEARKIVGQVIRDAQAKSNANEPSLLQTLRDGAKDCLAIKTGSVERIAYLIPAAERVIALRHKQDRLRDVRCLVISPTSKLAYRALADVCDVVGYYNAHFFTMLVCTGTPKKVAQMEELQLANEAHVLMTTPGRLLELLQGNLNLVERASKLQVLVMDNVDQLIEMGFGPSIERILELLGSSRGTRQTMLFSGTVTDEVRDIASIALRPGWNFFDTARSGRIDVDAHTHMHCCFLSSLHDAAANTAMMCPTIANQRESPVNGTAKNGLHKVQKKAPRPPMGKFNTVHGTPAFRHSNAHTLF